MADERNHSETEKRGDTDDFGPLTQRQTENVADFTIRRAASQQYEKLGRALGAKIVYFLGALGFAFWVHIDQKILRFLEWATK